MSAGIGARLGGLLLGVEQLETRSALATPDCSVLYMPATWVSGWLNWRTYWMKAWMLPRVIWPVATCSPPTTATAT